MKSLLLLGVLALASTLSSSALTINADFGRDTAARNPGTNPAPVLYAGTGPSGDAGTVWNDLRVPLAPTGDQGTDSVLHPILFENLTDSDGFATAIDIQLTNGFFRSFNSSATPSTAVTALQNDRIFPRNGGLATLTIQGLNPARSYTLSLIGSGFVTAFTIDSVSKVATGAAYVSAWVEGATHVTFHGLTPSPAGEIVVAIQDGAAPVDSFGSIAGLQISESDTPVRFLYAASVTSTGGEFSTAYPPANLMNNGFTSPDETIDTTVIYAASGNNYATENPTPNGGVFDLTFEFPSPTEIDGMHVWNYVFRSSTGGTTSYTSGVDGYELTFYDGPAATGSVIGDVFSGNLAEASFNALNTAQSVWFPTPYTGVRSVKMHVLGSHSGSGFTGMNELAFNGASETTPASIDSFTASAPFVQRPASPTLSWSVSGAITSLEITPAIGDVLPLTTAGSGSIPVSPLGEQTYTLTLNGSLTRTLSVVGLPSREKLHLYLLIGQSNMQGAGSPYNNTLDAPDPRVVKFGSRNGRETTWVKGGHPLTALATATGGEIGMGIEFGKSMLAAEADPEVVIGLINHAIGSSAIQWWAPGVIDNKQTNPDTGLNYYLYDEAVQRITDASQFGVLKGVLWHQGEYNSNSNSNPDSDPDGYAARLQALVTNLRDSFDNPFLPFVCGKFVPATWTYEDGSPGAFTGLPFRATVEAALMDLPNQRSNTFCVDNDGLRGRPDQLIHFDAYSQRLLGQRYAAAMAGFYADPFLLYLGGFYSPAELLDPQIIDPLGDNDLDGYGNFLEFAFLTDPSQTQDIVPVGYTTAIVPGEGEFPAIRFRQRFDSEAPDYLVQVSENLTTWISNLDGPPVTEMVGDPVDNGDGTSTVTVRLLAPLPVQFLRVQVSLP